MQRMLTLANLQPARLGFVFFFFYHAISTTLRVVTAILFSACDVEAATQHNHDADVRSSTSPRARPGPRPRRQTTTAEALCARAQDLGPQTVAYVRALGEDDEDGACRSRG